MLVITDFFGFKYTDIFDVLLVAILLYQLYRLMRGTAAINIFGGIVAVYFIWKLVNALQLNLLAEILGQFVSVGVIALIVVFQKEIRQFLLLIGTPRFLSRRQKWLAFMKMNVQKSGFLDTAILVKACSEMAMEKTGALIVLTKKDELNEFVNNGELIDSRISDQLIENIFFKNSPLHDGAIIISSNRIRAARCILPLTKSENFPASYGLRHRSAVGITENTDAISIIVSEQTGDIAYAKLGNLYTKIKPDALKEFLEMEFN